MRVLFSIYPNSRAHLYPIVPLAWALQSAGHEVRVSTHAGAVEQVIMAGLTPVALGDPDQPMVRETPDCEPPKQPEEVERYARIMGLTPEEKEHWIAFFQILLCPTSDYVRLDRPEPDDLIRFTRAWQPDLVIWDSTFPVAAVAAKLAGAAHCRFLIGHDLFGWSVDRLAAHRYELQAAGLDPNPLASLVRPIAERHGLAFRDELFLGQWSIETMLDGLRLPTSTKKLSVRHVPYVDPAVFPAWLYERRPGVPRVAFTLGESTRRFISGDWDRTPKILQALDGLDLDVVATLTTRQLHDVERLPDNVRIFDWVNLEHLLPTCSSVIHHGGIGTYSNAVATSVPQLVCDIEGESIMIRLVEDEPGELATGTLRNGLDLDASGQEQAQAPSTHWEFPAKKLEATHVSNFVMAKGAGARLDHRAQTIPQMRELIWNVATDPRYQDGAAALHKEWLATPSPSEIIPDLERLIAEHRGR